MPYIAYLFHLLIIPTRATGNPELEAALPYQQIYLETVLVRVISGNAGFGRTTIAQGEDAQPLLDALSQKQGQKGKTLDEVLDFAYVCLTEPE